MAELENKYIPMQGYASYNVPVRPPRVDNGRVRTPEEIEEGTKNFRHTFYLDETGHVYIIPSMDVDGKWVDAYSPTDVVRAAMGDPEAKAKLDKCRKSLKEFYGRDLMSDKLMQTLYDQEKGELIAAINSAREEDGLEPLDNIRLPKSPKTATNFTPSDLARVVASAKTATTPAQGADPKPQQP